MPGLAGVLTPPSAQLAFWTISFRNSPNRTVLVAHDDTGFLLFLWSDSVYLSIEIPVRKQLKSHETAVKRLLNGNCCRLGGVARVKNTENPFAEGQHSKKKDRNRYRHGDGGAIGCRAQGTPQLYGLRFRCRAKTAKAVYSRVFAAGQNS